jgi:hypothetical protein
MHIKAVVCKSLGAKEYDDNKKADHVCLIRFMLVALNSITCLFIIAGVILSHIDKF